jgi:hypothetical protein
MDKEKVALVDLSKTSISKALLNDLHKLSEEIHAEEVYVAISVKAANCNLAARNLIVYGFEKLSSDEAQRFTTMADYIFLKMDVNQEDDFVEL